MRTYKEFISICEEINCNENFVEEGIRRRIAAAGLAAATALGSAGAAKAGQFSGNANLRYGSTPATATNQSVSGAVDRALAKPGTSQSASSVKGKTGVTASGSLQYSGTAGSRPKPKPAPKPETSKTPTITVKNYKHADPKVDAALRKDPQRLANRVRQANAAIAAGDYNRPSVKNAIIGGKALNPTQARMTAQAREMNPTGITGVTMSAGDSRHKNDREAHKALYKSYKSSRM